MSETRLGSLLKIRRPGPPASSDTALAAQELLQNGILVETNKGLVCMSLKDALHQGVGGLNLSEEDFQNVATKLLFQEGPDKLIVPATVADDDSVLQVSDSESLLQMKPIRTIVHARPTLLKKRCSSTVSRILEPCLPSSSKSNIEIKLGDDVIDVEEFDSVLVSDSGLSSDTSEVVSLSNLSTNSVPAKKRGGWPKGRKRKPENKTDIRQPKAPVTGYVIYLNERRKEYKDLPFTEVTKILGNEWSRLSFQEKKKYLDQAEVDKKRYREELKTYRQSDAYRQYLQRKRHKRLQGHGTEESDMDATDEIDEEDNEELYCRSCDQWFHSLHNKKEHLYGRQHLARISGRGKSDEWPSCTSLDESSLDGCREDPKERKLTPISMDDALVRVMACNMERERELISLRQRHEESQRRNQSLLAIMSELKEQLETAHSMAQEEEQINYEISQSLLSLLGVHSLFSVEDN